MSCRGCMKSVTSVLNKLPGVAVQRVAVGSADVTYDPIRADPRKIATALEDAGFPARQAGETLGPAEPGRGDASCHG